MKVAVRLVALFFLLFWIINILIDGLKHSEMGYEVDLCEDYTEFDSLTSDRIHYRNWDLIDYRASYCTHYRSYEDLANQSRKKRNLINPSNNEYGAYWGSVYRQLVEENDEWVSFMADSLLQTALLDSLDAASLAELTVSFVQDIPYHFISSGDCSEADATKHPCVALAKFGILSPYEFLHTLSGDCDTRAVLLFSLLRKLNFDPMIVVSYEYRHAMLALNIPSSGDHITLGRKNYYFWETTAKGWPVGMLPPDMQNIDYWEIALVNEL
ncbi:hypothetical protein RT717_09940 [Imperialibacter roseus]|uniref:Transglutaminase-like domain-containing protein n=1 Tax=Imperialibacter roseus TaxID=1324217 RepID=A0ABZ0IXU9_9BACT|nr:hypothetical protein [Imperialibacter roseus]WOK08954.1 hypothetical protein RT717_09940 [Imperialibacter roseus]